MKTSNSIKCSGIVSYIGSKWSDFLHPFLTVAIPAQKFPYIIILIDEPTPTFDMSCFAAIPLRQLCN